ncbi:MAG: tRNA (N(6)-L-threonylcarbamoyladenosine(37)-C(2))-methylthiotransferase MtaB [Clostridia bacterium]|nr:tRNA (N(6)-L-threonylcarbamoyladenosine(37)-C(2))-methylthiotransferase MtaB [Clostridia bacterium]
MRTVSFCTLGCKVNQYETESLKELLIRHKYKVLDFSEVCDLYVINSCTVTAMADKKTRQMIARARRLNPKGVIALLGCMTEKLTEEEKEALGVDLIVGNSDKNKLADLVRAKTFKRNTFLAEDIMHCRTFTETPITGRHADRARGYIKIQDGCNRFCSYCIIPYVRGPVRSRDLENITIEAEKLAENKIREVILTGIQVGAYGDDFKKEVCLADAVEAAAKPEKILRVRLSSMEPTAITPEFLQRCKDTNKFCDHFHLSLQSGCDKILKAMNRRYTTAEYLEKCKLIREYFPDAAITTDVIVGFPGETEDDFIETVSFLREAKLSKIHVFPYSPRAGTKASTLPDQNTRQTKHERVRALTHLSDTLRKDFIESQMHKNKQVYFEKYEDGYNYGYTSNYIYVRKKFSKSLIGTVKELQLSEVVLFDEQAEE